MNLSTQIHLPGLIGNRPAWTGSLRDIIYDDAAMCHWDEIARLHDLDPDEDDFDLADHADTLTLADVRKLADDPNAEVVSTHITPDTIAYLAGEGTPDQQADFQAGAELIDEVYASRYPDSPDDLEAMAADQYVGAAMYALGDTTLKEAGKALQEARRAYMEASDQLAGAMCVARRQGMSVSEIASAADVRRSIVYKRTEPKL